MIKTYMAPGLVDFKLVLRAGPAWVAVDFIGGRANGFGQHSAVFTTAEKPLQYLIEKSPEFLSGKIVIKPNNS